MRFFILFILLVCSLRSIGQVSVAASVDSTNILIGDQFRLHLYVNHPPNTTIQQVDLSKLKHIENLEIIAESPWDTTRSGSEVVLQKDLTLQVFDSGYYWIPAIPFNYVWNGAARVAMTDQIPIAVSTVVLPDSVQLADIKDILREEQNWEDWLPILLAMLAIGLVVGLFYFLKKRKKRKEIPPPPEIKLPAHEIALTALARLKSEKLWQQGQVKTYQSRLTHIIREYLENRYNIPALESTTDEILRYLKKVDFDNQWKDKLQNILQIADLVKFAKAKPAVDFHDKVLQEAKAFILATKVQPVLVETKGE